MIVSEAQEELVPGTFLYSAALGLPRNWQVLRYPEDLSLVETEVLMIVRSEETVMPRKSVLFTSRSMADQLEQGFKLKRVFTKLTNEEKMRQINGK